MRRTRLIGRLVRVGPDATGWLTRGRVRVGAVALSGLATAASCPALSPSKLAGQVMEASGFDTNAHTADGGVGLAGLTDSLWNAWQPWPGADRADPEANIVALAHYACDLVSQVRDVGGGVDPWLLALAAHTTDVPTVRSAGATNQKWRRGLIPVSDPCRQHTLLRSHPPPPSRIA